jgi:hypothetical protein
MSVVVAHAIPDDVLVGERARLLAMVDILESVPPEEVWALARRSAFARLDARDAVLVAPDEHGDRLLLLLEGRAQVYEEGHPGRELTVSVVEGGTLVGATGFAPPPLAAARRSPEVVDRLRREAASVRGAR